MAKQDVSKEADSKNVLTSSWERLSSYLPFGKRRCKPNADLARLEAALQTRVLVEPLAGVRLERFPASTLSRLLDAVIDWSKSTDVQWVRVAAIKDPEDPTWGEVALKLAIAEQDDARWCFGRSSLAK